MGRGTGARGLGETGGQERHKGAGGLGRGGSFTSVDFSVQSDGLREVEEVMTYMLAFTQDFNTPQTFRRRPYSTTPETMMDIPP